MSPVDRAALFRVMGISDLYFLLRYILLTRFWKHPENEEISLWENEWILARCREIQFDSNNRLNIWARYHGKSTICTFGLGIQSILVDPNITVGIFSITRPIADTFVGQIKAELESNEELKRLYPDVLYEEPRKEAQSWSIQNGIIVKRPLNLKDPTLRGYGLLDTNFSGTRTKRMIFDDAVNETVVTTPEMIDKTNDKWALSLATGFPGTKRFYIGTYYARGDTYHTMADRGVKPRVYPCYEIDKDKSRYEPSGTPVKLYHLEDRPVLYSAEHIEGRRQEMGPKVFAIQMLCDPSGGDISVFKRSWLRHYKDDPMRLAEQISANIVIVVDPAGYKKKDNSFTAMWVVALGDDGNFYVVDGVLDHLDLGERTDRLFEFVYKWSPVEVRYERVSMQADIQHIEHVMEERNYRFNIAEVKAISSKQDRIERLVPLFRQSRIWLPESILFEPADGGEMRDMVKMFIEQEYLQFPNSKYMDALDALSRIAEKDMPLMWPRSRSQKFRDSWREDLYRREDRPEGSWLSE